MWTIELVLNADVTLVEAGGSWRFASGRRQTSIVVRRPDSDSAWRTLSSRGRMALDGDALYDGESSHAVAARIACRLGCAHLRIEGAGLTHELRVFPLSPKFLAFADPSMLYRARLDASVHLRQVEQGWIIASASGTGAVRCASPSPLARLLDAYASSAPSENAFTDLARAVLTWCAMLSMPGADRSGAWLDFESRMFVERIRWPRVSIDRMTSRDVWRKTPPSTRVTSTVPRDAVDHAALWRRLDALGVRDALSHRQSWRDRAGCVPLTVEDIDVILRACEPVECAAATGVTPVRLFPSAGGLYAVRARLFVSSCGTRVAALHVFEPATGRVISRPESPEAVIALLEQTRRRLSAPDVPDAVVLLACDWDVYARRYGHLGVSLALRDVGVMLGFLDLMLNSLGFACCIAGGVDDLLTDALAGRMSDDECPLAGAVAIFGCRAERPYGKSSVTPSSGDRSSGPVENGGISR